MINTLLTLIIVLLILVILLMIILIPLARVYIQQNDAIDNIAKTNISLADRVDKLELTLEIRDDKISILEHDIEKTSA